MCLCSVSVYACVCVFVCACVNDNVMNVYNVKQQPVTAILNVSQLIVGPNCYKNNNQRDFHCELIDYWPYLFKTKI